MCSETEITDWPTDFNDTHAPIKLDIVGPSDSVQVFVF